MLRFAADENFNANIIRGLRRRKPDLDIIRIQDAGLSGKEDPVILDWAATEKRLLLTHDVSTMSRYAYERVEEGLSMPGLFEVPRNVPSTLSASAWGCIDDSWIRSHRSSVCQPRRGG